MSIIARITPKLEKLLDSLEDPDSLEDLEFEWHDIIIGIREIQERIKEFEIKLDKIIKEREKK